MASYTANYAKSATLGVSTVDTVVLTGNTPSLEIVNHSASVPIYVKAGPNVATDPKYPTDPAVGGDECFAVPAGGRVFLRWPFGSDTSACLVKLISAAAASYTVQGSHVTL